MRGDEAVEILPVAEMGYLQAQARYPMPGFYIDPTGDQYVIDSDERISVVRDGRLRASGEWTSLAVCNPGMAQRFLCPWTRGDDRSLGVTVSKPRGISHARTDSDCDTKYRIERP